MPRLPQPDGDAGRWGTILNEFLEVEHNADGTLKNVARPVDITNKADVDDTYTKSEVDSQLSTKLDQAFIDDITPGTNPEVIVGSATGPAKRTADYDQVLRRSGDTLQFRNTKEAYLNDRSDIDPTGSQDMGETISNYLAELASKGVTKVYCDAGSIYSTSSTIDIPPHLQLIGPKSHYGTVANQQATFRALNDEITIFRLTGRHSCLEGVRIDMGNRVNVVGVRPNSHFQIIDNCMFVACSASSTAVKGGGILYFTMRENTFTGGFSGRAIDLRDSYADNPSVVYYGVNVGWFERNIFAGPQGAFRAEGIFTVRDNDFEGGSGSVNPALTVGGGSRALIEGNYFEMEGNSQAIYLQISASGTISNNVIYGVSSTRVGSYGVGFEGYVFHLTITGNAFNRLERGIGDILVTGTNDPSALITSNTYSQVGTKVGAKSGRMMVMDPDAGYYFGTRFYGVQATRRDGQGLILNLLAANLFHLDYTTGGVLTYTNAIQGQVFYLVFEQGNLLLQNSVWNLASGVDETPVAGTVKAFAIHQSWGNAIRVRELAPRDIPGSLIHTGSTAGFFGVAPITRPSALTAPNNGTVSSGDATTDGVIETMRTRIDELEGKLQSLGLLE